MPGKMTEGSDGKRRFNPQNTVELYDENGNSYGIRQIDNKPRVSSTPYLYDIAEGKFSDHFAKRIFGTNPDNATTLETVWCEGGIYEYPSAAGIWTVSCANVNDTSEGTGARTLSIYGLDENYNEINETISLNGQTAVNTVKEYLRLYEIVVETAGSGGTNIGGIYVGTGIITNGVPATVYCCLCAELGKSIMAVWTVPAEHTFHIADFVVSTNANKGLDIELFIRPFGGVFQIRYRIYLYGNSLPIPFELPMTVLEKSDIEVRAKAVQAGGGCGAEFSGWYEEN